MIEFEVVKPKDKDYSSFYIEYKFNFVTSTILGSSERLELAVKLIQAAIELLPEENHPQCSLLNGVIEEL